MCYFLITLGNKAVLGIDLYLGSVGPKWNFNSDLYMYERTLALKLCPMCFLRSYNLSLSSGSPVIEVGRPFK